MNVLPLNSKEIVVGMPDVMQTYIGQNNSEQAVRAQQ